LIVAELAKWIWTQFAVLFAIPEVRAGFAALALGVAMTDFVARMLPARMDADYAYRLMRLFVFGISTVAAFWLNPSPLGLVVALIVGAAAPAVQVLSLRAIYAKWPAMKPESLIACSTDKPAPPSIVK
jgi:hypothetical protein